MKQGRTRELGLAALGPKRSIQNVNIYKSFSLRPIQAVAMPFGFFT
jgi:hypothetical protein